LAVDFDQKYKKGVQIGDLVPQAAMIAGLLNDATINFNTDEWLMAGFSMYADKPYTSIFG